ncbi:protein transport protein S31 [Thecaphora frezii]
MKATINRTATFTWSPSALQSDSPWIATGTVAGALDESFSNESVLEIWQPNYSTSKSQQADAQPLGSVATSARFNRLAWGYVNPSRPKGLLAAGLENGELGIWDADKILGGLSSDDSQVMKNTTHTGPVRGLDFNSLQPNLLSSGAVNGEIFIWDLNSPGKPYSPGARSQKLDEITSLAWNAQVPHVLATSSSSGYTVVWDLKGKREVVALQYGGGAGTAGGSLGGMNGMGGALAAGGRRGMSAVAWHPDTPTRLVTASEDDTSPVIMLWDLRNSRAPEQVLTGHDKGVLSLSWCKQDADLLLSCGKDNRAICWNPQTCEIVGELPSSSNWSFEVQWCPRNPGMLATASFDGRIGVHSLQTTTAAGEGEPAALAPVAEGSDFFNMPTQKEPPSKGLSLKQPPKWLRRPVSAVFGFGGQLISTSNLPGPNGKTQSSAVHLRDIVTEPSIVQRATKLQQALDSQTLADFCDERSKDPTTRQDDVANWKALQTLFRADSRDELVALLGFSKEDVAAKVSSAIAAFKSSDVPSAAGAANATATTAEGAETAALTDATVEAEDAAAAPEEGNAAEATAPSAAGQEDGAAPREASLFGDESAGDNGVATDASGADFFSQFTGPDASASEAAAVDPAASSVDGAAKRNPFRIYPAEESTADKLITRALVLGDFESAVSLCISSDRFADALLLAVRGGQDLLARTQKAYFEKRTAQLPYLRLLQSIVSEDLTDVVQNAELAEWQEIFVVLCTFAKQDEFGNLAEQLGQRLESQYLATQGGDPAVSKEHRKNAVLCYLAAGRLEKVAGMWIDEMREEELALRQGAKGDAAAEQGTLYSAHAEALQTFMEKITVFQSAVGYVDTDLHPAQNGFDAVDPTNTRNYKLGALYDRIHEYVELLADQGLIAPALRFVDQTPADYRPKSSALPGLAGPSTVVGLTAGAIKERLLQAEAARPKATDSGAASRSHDPYAAAAPAQAATNGYGYNQYAAPAQTVAVPAPAGPSIPSVPLVPAVPNYSSQDPYAAAAPSQPVAAQPQTQSRYAPAVPAPVPNAMGGQHDAQAYSYNPYSTPAQGYAPAEPMVPPPPPMGASYQSKQQALPPPPPLKRDNSGWNDVPEALAAPIRTTSAMGQKAKAITSPFPNSPAATPAPYGAAPPQGPPRGSTPSRGLMSPPPPAGGPQYGARPGGVQSPPGYRSGPGAASIPPPPRPGQAGPPPPGVYGQPQQPQQQQMPPGIPGQVPGQGGTYGRPPSAMGSYGPPGVAGPPGAARPPPGPGMQVPGQHQPGMPGMPGMAPPGGAPVRAVTPGAGAGAPARSGTPGAKPASALKYSPGDRSHIPENQKPILQTLLQELTRLKSVTPPTQKRMVDDTERRINLLLDHLNCGTVDAKMVQGLLQLVGAINARNQAAALSIHLQLATSATGDITAALVGVKMLISRMSA